MNEPLAAVLTSTHVRHSCAVRTYENKRCLKVQLRMGCKNLFSTENSMKMTLHALR